MDAEIYQTIEDYLLEKLDTEARAEVEENIRTSPEYAATVAAFKLALQEIEQVGNYRLEERIKMLEAKLTDQGWFIDEDEILAYLDGNVSDEVRSQIEQRMKTDEAFAEKIKTLRLVNQEIERGGQESLADKIKREAEKLEKEGFFSPQAQMDKTSPKPKIRHLQRYQRIAAAAAVILISVFSIYYLLQPSTADLSTAYLAPMEDHITPELSGNFAPVVRLQDSLEQAMAAFGDQDYRQAQSLFEIFLASTPEAPPFTALAQLYLAQTLLFQELQPDKVKQLLLPLSTDETFPYQTDAQWYLAHHYLQTKNEAEAIRILQELIGSTQYGTSAQAILQAL